MIINSFSANNYRNIENLSLEPCGGINIIYGDNAQGKTNLLEGMWLFTGYKSFRGSRDAELKSFGSDFARLTLEYTGNVRRIGCELTVDDKRKVKQNGVLLDSPSELIGGFLAVVFAPSHLSLVKSGPAARRQFLDIAISRHSPRYSESLSRYRHALEERNSLLKDLRAHSELYETCELWEQQLAAYGAAVVYDRYRYTAHLMQAAQEIYAGLCAGCEQLDVLYEPSGCKPDGVLNKKELAAQLANSYAQERSKDISLQFTTTGPHRDDIAVKINSQDARSYGSQGQQRSAALALKLGESRLIKEITGEVPVILLDDVMSELDPGRQDYILNKTEQTQVFITCCEPTQALRARTGREFKINRGGLC